MIFSIALERPRLRARALARLSADSNAPVFAVGGVDLRRALAELAAVEVSTPESAEFVGELAGRMWRVNVSLDLGAIP